MNVHTESWLKPYIKDRITFGAVHRHVVTMGVQLFEVGLYKADAVSTDAPMIPRIWDGETILKSVPWLRHQNLNGRNIYLRPKGTRPYLGR